MILLDEFVYIIFGSHLKIAPSLNNLGSSYAIHRSAWNMNSTKFAGKEFSELRHNGVLGRWDEKADPLYAIPLEGLQMLDGL
jgi:hypothetical protein